MSTGGPIIIALPPPARLRRLRAGYIAGRFIAP